MKSSKLILALSLAFLMVMTNLLSIPMAQAKPEGRPDWDRSSLSFDESYCCKVTDGNIVSAKVINGADSRPMEGTTIWELWYAETGNPKNGTKVAEGVIPALNSGESYVIDYEVTASGNYKFMAYQREGHPGIGVLWSETCTVIIDEQAYPNIEIEKEVSDMYARVGETIKYFITIRNIGNVPLSNIDVTDETLNLERVIEELDVDESVTIELSYKIPSGTVFPFANRAEVEVTYNETKITDFDTAIVYEKLRLTSMCSEDPDFSRRWRVTNNNDFDILFTWELVGTELTDELIVEANSIVFFETETKAGPNTVKILVDGKQHDVKASSGAKCNIPGISITKTADKNEYKVGEEITYTSFLRCRLFFLTTY